MTSRDRLERTLRCNHEDQACFFSTCSSPGDAPLRTVEKRDEKAWTGSLDIQGDIQGASPKNQGHSRVTTGPPARIARSAHREETPLETRRDDVPWCFYRRAGASESRSG